MSAGGDLDVLRASLGDDAAAAHPLVFSGATPPRPDGTNFWEAHYDRADFQGLADGLLAHCRGDGRLIAIADAAEDCSRRQFAALQLARLLNDAGKRVLLIDAQLDGSGFSAGFDEVESEGLIDLVLYGSSPMTTVQPSPILGLWMMGAGSFRADGELDADGLHRALAQLRSTHELVLLALPTHRADGRFSEFFVHVDGVVLCAAGDSSAALGDVIEYLRAQNVPLWGAISFGGAAAKAAVQPSAPAARSPRARPATSQPADEDRSSPLFRRALWTAVVVLLAFAGWWAATQLRSTPPTVAQNPPADRTPSAQPVPAPAESPVQPPAQLPAEQAAAEDGLADDSQASADEQTSQPAGDELKDTASQPSESPGETVTAPENTPERQPEVAAQRSDEPQLSPIERDLRAAPGEGGWSLHLWSFRLASEAETAAVGLRSEGLTPRVLEVDLNELGLWYRVVVGRYERRGDAASGRALMAGWPGVEHVGLVRVP